DSGAAELRVTTFGGGEAHRSIKAFGIPKLAPCFSISGTVCRQPEVPRNKPNRLPRVIKFPVGMKYFKKFFFCVPKIFLDLTLQTISALVVNGFRTIYTNHSCNIGDCFSIAVHIAVNGWTGVLVGP